MSHHQSNSSRHPENSPLPLYDVQNFDIPLPLPLPRHRPSSHDQFPISESGSGSSIEVEGLAYRLYSGSGTGNSNTNDMPMPPNSYDHDHDDYRHHDINTHPRYPRPRYHYDQTEGLASRLYSIVRHRHPQIPNSILSNHTSSLVAASANTNFPLHRGILNSQNSTASSSSFNLSLNADAEDEENLVFEDPSEIESNTPTKTLRTKSPIPSTSPSPCSSPTWSAEVLAERHKLIQLHRESWNMTSNKLKLDQLQNAFEEEYSAEKFKLDRLERERRSTAIEGLETPRHDLKRLIQFSKVDSIRRAIKSLEERLTAFRIECLELECRRDAQAEKLRAMQDQEEQEIDQMSRKRKRMKMGRGLQVQVQAVGVQERNDSVGSDKENFLQIN